MWDALRVFATAPDQLTPLASFDELHELTAALSGDERLAVFSVLPVGVCRVMWHRLAFDQEGAR